MDDIIRKEQVNLTAPIKIKSSDQYPIIIEDANRVFHYFTETGKYDGYSKDCDPTIDHPELQAGEGEVEIFTEPMTEKERSENLGKPLKMSSRYHLIDCLKDLQFGRPAENQKQITKWITELNVNLDKGVTFT